MDIYKIRSAEGYEFVNSSNQVTRSVFRTFNGKARKCDWKPVSVKLVSSDRGIIFKHSDFFYIGAAPLIMRKRAVEALIEIWNTNGEILPLDEESGEALYIFNSQCIDALDEIHSDITRFKSSGRIMKINSYIFDKENLKGCDIFHLPGSPHIIYVSQQFVNLVEAKGLKGIEFIHIWQSTH